MRTDKSRELQLVGVINGLPDVNKQILEPLMTYHTWILWWWWSWVLVVVVVVWHSLEGSFNGNFSDIIFTEFFGKLQF